MLPVCGLKLWGNREGESRAAGLTCSQTGWPDRNQGLRSCHERQAGLLAGSCFPGLVHFIFHFPCGSSLSLSRFSALLGFISFSNSVYVIYLFIHLYIHPSIYPSTHPPVCLCPPVHPSTVGLRNREKFLYKYSVTSVKMQNIGLDSAKI